MPESSTNEPQRVQEAVEKISSVAKRRPKAAIILGSGLGGLADRIDTEATIAYEEIPGFVGSSAGGHRGELILGTLESVDVIAMAGRFHRYEGWSTDQIAFPVRVMNALGASTLIVSNAAGGVSPKLRVGDIVVIRDHINWIGCPSRSTFSDHLAGNSTSNPAAIPATATPAGMPGRRANVYDRELSDLALRVAVENQFNAWYGTYLATLGPNYETRSEYRMMRKLGADVAGMSTVPEVLAAADGKMRTLGLSMVSNVANPDVATKADHEEVLEAGRAAETMMESIVRRVVRHIA